MPYGMAFPPVVAVAGITKSWTCTRCGVFAGRQVRPAFLNAPTSSFFLVSTEIVGCCCRCARRTRRAMYRNCGPDRHAGGPHESWRCPAGCSPVRATTRRPPCYAVAQTVERHRNVRALWHVHRSGESGSPGAVGSTNASKSRSRSRRDRSAYARPSRPAARERLVRVNSRKPRWMVDVAIPVARATSAVPSDRLGLSRRPHPARSLREHGRQRACFARRVANSTGAAYYSPINRTSSYFRD